jgi:hypothetical protein
MDSIDSDYIYFLQQAIPAELDARFNELYNTDHIPLMLQAPGVKSATRYKSLYSPTGNAPDYLAIYAVDGADIPRSPKWKEQTSKGAWPTQMRPHFTARRNAAMVRDVTQIAGAAKLRVEQIVDARSPARFRGEVEPLDTVAGHIPGALNRPFTDNFAPDGRFKTAEVLRAEFTALLGQREPQSVVHHCGSGVSAIPNLLAMEIAGLGRTALYAGSWSEWCNTSGLPVARG